MKPPGHGHYSGNLAKCIKTLLCLVAAFGLGTSDSSAQIFKPLHVFSASGWPPTNSDGAQPYNTGVILSGNTLYGTTYYGGVNGNGAVVSVNTDGSGFTTLHTFTKSYAPDYTNVDGEYPQGSLTLLGDTLYGTTLNGGTNSGGYGTIYSVKTNGDSFVRLHSFNLADGSNPNGPLVIANGRIYGTTETGGAGDNGTVFSLNLDGADFTVLHAFTNVDGHFPNGVVLAGDTLYGSAFLGGSNGTGTIFSIKTNGDDFQVLHTFNTGTSGYYNQFNDDGKNPQMPVTVSGNTLYGTATFGGANARGTLFSLATNGSNFTVLHMFSDLAGPGAQYNEDGAYPMGTSVSNGVLYGVTSNGGSGGNGVAYAINADGSHFAVLHAFSEASPFNYHTNYDGAYPEGAPVLAGNTLYGTAEQGGTGNGTVFSLILQPNIAGIQLDGTNLVINGFNAVLGENCVTLASPDLALPLADWTPVATNVLTSGNFNFIATNAVDPAAPKRFYTLQTP